MPAKSPEALKRKRAATARWRKNNPDKILRYQRRHYRQKKFGVSPQDYERMLAAQKGRCEICKRLPGTKELAVDHDHRTDRVRGLLCFRCNVGIGQFDDSAELLLKAAEYLRDI